MISLLEDPEEMYKKYLKEIGDKDGKDDEEEEEGILRDEKLVINREREEKIDPQYFKDVKSKKIWRNIIDQTLKKNKSFKENKKKQQEKTSQENNKLKYDKGEDEDELAQSRTNKRVAKRENYGLLTFQEFNKENHSFLLSFHKSHQKP